MNFISGRHVDFKDMGVSQNEAAGTGSLSQGSVSRVCFAKVELPSLT